MLKQKMHITIRKFAILIGKMVAAEPGVEHAPLFYKPLEKVKDTELRCHNGNFDRFMKSLARLSQVLNGGSVTFQMHISLLLMVPSIL